MGNQQILTEYQKNKKIIWSDPNVFNSENQKFYVDSLKGLNVFRVEDFKKAYQIITDTDETVIVISSGTNGEKLVKMINEETNILGILIFCNDVNFHEKWAQNFKQIIKVTNSGQIIKEEIVNILKTCTPDSDRKYIEVSSRVARAFWRVVLNYMGTLQKKKSFKNEDILSELSRLNTGEAKNIEKIFEAKKAEILKAVLFLYSTNYLYKDFNGQLQKRLYKTLLNSLTVTAQNLLLNDKYADLYHTQGAVLHRGIYQSSSSLIEFKRLMNNNVKPLYFPAFVSTTSKKEVAMQFSDGIIFEIHLSQKNPHPHIMLINEEWTQFPKEKETLLFSYFPFFIENIVFDGKFNVITLIQDESQVVFSKDLYEMKQYWNKVIKETLEKENDVVLKENIINDILETFNMNEYEEYNFFDCFKAALDQKTNSIEKFGLYKSFSKTLKVLHFTQFNEFCLPKEALISGAKEIGLELDLIEMDIDKEGITNLLEAPRIENLDAVLVSSYRKSKNQIQTAEDLPKLFGDYLYRYAYTNTIVLVNSDNSSQSHRPTGNFTNLHPLDPLQESEDYDTELHGWWQPVINNHPLFE